MLFRALDKPQLKLIRMCSQSLQFETLSVTRPAPFVVQVELNRPEKRNAINQQMLGDIKRCFERLDVDPDCRSVLLVGAGKLFCSGIDLSYLMEMGKTVNSDMDVARKGWSIRKQLVEFQNILTAVNKCEKPVISAIHSACIGAGCDLISAVDVRYATTDTQFSIKEVEMGLAADVGTLQRFGKIVGNDSLLRELAFTARNFGAEEAKQLGLVSAVFPDRESMLAAGLELAKLIASKSPIAVQGSKVNLNFARDHSAQDSLEFIAAWNQGMLLTEDTVKAATAALSKQGPPEFAKL